MNETMEKIEIPFNNLDAEVDMEQLEQGLIEILQNVRQAVNEVIQSIESSADTRFHTPQKCSKAMTTINKAEKLGLNLVTERASLKNALSQSKLKDLLDKGGPYFDFFKED